MVDDGEKPLELQYDVIIMEIWHKTVHLCTRVLHHVEIYGFDFMTLPDPNIKEFEQILSFVVCPLLDEVVKHGNLEADHDIAVVNIRQYSLHLRDMTKALREDNRNDFEQAAPMH